MKDEVSKIRKRGDSSFCNGRTNNLRRGYLVLYKNNKLAGNFPPVNTIKGLHIHNVFQQNLFNEPTYHGKSFEYGIDTYFLVWTSLEDYYCQVSRGNSYAPSRVICDLCKKGTWVNHFPDMIL